MCVRLGAAGASRGWQAEQAAPFLFLSYRRLSPPWRGAGRVTAALSRRALACFFSSSSSSSPVLTRGLFSLFVRAGEAPKHLQWRITPVMPWTLVSDHEFILRALDSHTTEVVHIAHFSSLLRPFYGGHLRHEHEKFLEHDAKLKLRSERVTIGAI